MKARYLLLVLCLLLIALPASAIVLNASILAGSSQTIYEPPFPWVSAFNTAYASHVVTAPSGYMITRTNIEPKNNGDINFAFTKQDSSLITGTIEKHTSSVTTDLVTVSITGGSSNSFTFNWLQSPAFEFVYLQVNATNEYYFAALPAGDFASAHRNYQWTDVSSDLLTTPIGGEYYSYVFDTTTIPNINLGSSHPTLNPIVSTSVSSTNALIYHKVGYEEITHVDQKITNVINDGVVAQNWWDVIVAFIYFLWGAFQLASSTLTFAMSLLGYLIGGASFLFKKETIATVIGVYLAITMILSIHDSDDMFKSLGKFIRYQKKFVTFFIDIIKWIKEIVKWW